MDEMESTVAEPETVESEGPSAEETLNAELDQIYEEHTSEGEVAPKDAPVQASTPENAQPTPEEVKPIAAPASWGKDAQTIFSQLPTALQAEVAKRETERERAIGQAFQMRQQVEQAKQVLEPVMQGFNDLSPYFNTFRKADGSPMWGDQRAMMQEIKDVLATKQLLFRDPKAGLQAVMDWMRSAGLNLDGIDSQTQIDPETARLRQRLAQLEQDNQRRDSAERERQAETQRQEAVQRVAYGLNDFAQAKDDAGNPLYPHLFGDHGAKVGELMGKWMRANAGSDGITPDLFKAAYEAAIFSVAETREAEFKARENARVAEFKKNSDRARKAAGINPRSNRAPEVDPKKPIEEVFEDIWAKYNS